MSTELLQQYQAYMAAVAYHAALKNYDNTFRGVEITPAYTHISDKEMARDGVPGGQCLSRSEHHTFPLDPSLQAQAFQQQLLQLKKQHQMQQQVLLQHYHSQQQHLAEQHDHQLRLHLKEFREHQKALEEQRERREKEKLEALKKKEKHEQSAVASSEVKQRLQGFLLNKKQREAAAANGTGASPLSLRWGDPPPTHPLPHPYHLNPHIHSPAFEDDFPLRKTASEPNLLKLRIKQRVIERRASPLARRNQRLVTTLKNKTSLPNSSGSSTDGGTSPSMMSSMRTSPASNTPIQEEPESSGYDATGASGSLSDISLYSSPSMPNISLGRPPSHSSSEAKLPTVCETSRPAFSARLGGSLTGRMLTNTLPFYPALTGTAEPPAYVDHLKKLEDMQANLAMESEPSPEVESTLSAPDIGGPTNSQVAHARLHKAGHRPLGRTQSAPLPLGHPMLQGTPADTRHHLLKQQIRATVLTRAGRHLEETVDETAEVIDLTESEMSRQQRDRQQFLQQQRDLMMRHNANSQPPVEGAGVLPRVPGHVTRPLSRALSSPLVALGNDIPLALVNSHSHIPKVSSGRVTTGLAFDSLMLKHACVCGDNSSHPEHGGRLQSVWARLVETGLVGRCDKLRARKATVEEIQSVHSEAHALLFGTNPLNRLKLDMNKLASLPIKNFVRLPCGGVGVDSDTTWNELHTAPAARMAVGCVVDLAFKTATGEMKNAFAVVRPPGHHAEASQAMGFCFFNAVAIAAKLLLQRLRLKKILILDWDVHHGNGTQQMFYDDPRVLYLSLHRHDDGNFFPGTGGPTECGEGDAVGFNVNVAFSGGLQPPMGDAEYLAAFRTVVMPIAQEFDPDIVLVSAGFDGAAGHPPPLGGYQLSAACFGYMTEQVMTLANGKVVLALEGGYDLPSICDAAQECVRALLGDPVAPLAAEELSRPPCPAALETLHKTISIQRVHWPVLDRLAHTLATPYTETDRDDTVKRMAGLSMQPPPFIPSSEAQREPDEPEAMEEDDAK